MPAKGYLTADKHTVLCQDTRCKFNGMFHAPQASAFHFGNEIVHMDPDGRVWASRVQTDAERAADLAWTLNKPRGETRSIVTKACEHCKGSGYDCDLAVHTEDCRHCGGTGER